MRIAFYYIVTISIVFVHTQETFCGSKLNRALKKFCILHNTPDQRIRRQIVTECCYNKCSVKYLVSNYCQSYDREALENYLQRVNRIIQSDKDLKDSGLKIHSLERRKRRKTKGCSCKSKAEKEKILQDKIFLLNRTRKTPRSKVGQIEEAQRPFYVLNRF